MRMLRLPSGGLDTRLLVASAARVASLMGEQSKAPGGVSAPRSGSVSLNTRGVRGVANDRPIY